MDLFRLVVFQELFQLLFLLLLLFAIFALLLIQTQETYLVP